MLGLSQKEIAEAISVDVPMYSRYERNQRPIKEEQIEIIASKLNVDKSQLRKMWFVDKVLAVIHEEKDATDILNIAVENINDYRASKDGY